MRYVSADYCVVASSKEGVPSSRRLLGLGEDDAGTSALVVKVLRLGKVCSHGAQVGVGLNRVVVMSVSVGDPEWQAHWSGEVRVVSVHSSTEEVAVASKPTQTHISLDAMMRRKAHQNRRMGKTLASRQHRQFHWA